MTDKAKIYTELVVDLDSAMMDALDILDLETIFNKYIQHDLAAPRYRFMIQLLPPLIITADAADS